MRTPSPKPPKVAKHRDHEKLEPSAHQLNPSLASPHDFEVLQNGGQDSGRVTPFPGHYGETQAERKKMLKRDRDRGKGSAGTPLDEHGSRLAPHKI